MKTPQKISNGPAPRRAFLKNSVSIFAGLGAATALIPEAQAAFGPGKVPTTLTLAVTASTPITGMVTVTARVQRLDGRTTGLSGHQIHLYAGDATYPRVSLGYRWTNNSGIATLTFRASTMRERGNYVLIADMNPTGIEGWIANPRPFARFRVV
jgi:hypothetical protein